MALNAWKGGERERRERGEDGEGARGRAMGGVEQSDRPAGSPSTRGASNFADSYIDDD